MGLGFGGQRVVQATSSHAPPASRTQGLVVEAAALQAGTPETLWLLQLASRTAWQAYCQVRGMQTVARMGLRLVSNSRFGEPWGGSDSSPCVTSAPSR